MPVMKTVVVTDRCMIHKMWRSLQLLKIIICPMTFGFATVEHVDTTVTSRRAYEGYAPVINDVSF